MKAIFLSTLFIISILGLGLFLTSNANADNKNLRKGEDMNNNINDITVKDMNGKDIKLADYKGKVLLIVNVASKCGYTKQYKGLQEIYDKYNSRGFEILAFPCDQFGGQEPGTNEEIAEFCTANFGVTFKLFDKIEVNGNKRSPLYERLTNSSAVDKGDIKWNFEKFLIAKNGDIAARYSTKVDPTNSELISALEAELGK